MVTENRAGVKIVDPNMGPLIGDLLSGYRTMHVVGLDEVDAFIASRMDCHASEALRALVSELAVQTWKDASSMARDYPSATFNGAQQVAFNLAPCSIAVDCVVDFRTGALLIECCRPNICRNDDKCGVLLRGRS